MFGCPAGFLFDDGCLLHLHSAEAFRQALKTCEERENASSMVCSGPKGRILHPRRYRLPSTSTHMQLNEQHIDVADTAPYVGFELISNRVGDGKTMKRIKKTKQVIGWLKQVKHISSRMTLRVAQAVYYTFVSPLMCLISRPSMKICNLGLQNSTHSSSESSQSGLADECLPPVCGNSRNSSESPSRPFVKIHEACRCALRKRASLEKIRTHARQHDKHC